ncbi:MAG: hypothetical protein IK002_10380 [Treponema sp.]|uniref:hypothetical protein n=1 Tax=Treponema sp. TaxID=166 RepID=UPI00298E37B5|nr:hypothetical protein [Treponema sp.]MBR5934381.1 hypothetical protein [Treponema sp.]
MKKVFSFLLSFTLLLICSCKSPETHSSAPLVDPEHPFLFGYYKDTYLTWECNAPNYKLEFDLLNGITGEITVPENRQPGLWNNKLLNSFNIYELDNVTWSDGNSHSITAGSHFICTGWALSSQYELLSQKNIKWDYYINEYNNLSGTIFFDPPR